MVFRGTPLATGLTGVHPPPVISIQTCIRCSNCMCTKVSSQTHLLTDLFLLWMNQCKLLASPKGYEDMCVWVCFLWCHFAVTILGIESDSNGFFTQSLNGCCTGTGTKLVYIMPGATKSCTCTYTYTLTLDRFQTRYR